MRLKQLLHLVPLALAGCVGSNTALFMTKSNAGLDLDMKPPTAEINISRKEGVVEPSFEGGQTPPVLASFSTKIGHDKMDSFFFGVDQTFAGGDAALTMAKLYDKPDDFAGIDKENGTDEHPKLTNAFDSKLTLSEPPKANAKEGFLGWRKKLFGLAKPGEVRPFFFGTDTQFGLKVGWNGVGGPYPDTVKVGFNRKELAIAPVTINDQNEVKIPSFLATVDSKAKGAITPGTNSLGVKQDVNWLQYFATGQSADYLARQHAVRKAMLDRADPKAAAASDAEVQKKALEMVKNADKQIEGIIAHVNSPENNVVADKLASITNGVPGMSTKWFDKYAGKPTSKLQATLGGPDNAKVETLFNNIK